MTADLETAPLPLLTDAERRHMLADIARVSLAVGTDVFAERQWDDLDVAHGSLTERKSPIERLHFLQQSLPRLAQSVEQITLAPTLRPLRETRMVSPPVRARRVGTAALLAAARRGVPLRAIEETRVTVSPDTLENRAVKAFLHSLQGDARTIARMADAEGEIDAAQAASDCISRLTSLLSADFWQDVTTDNAPPVSPPRMPSAPPYAHIHTLMQSYYTAFCYSWDAPLFTIPAREAWRVYEMWCVFMTAQALKALGFAAQTQEQTLLAVRQGRLCVTLATGRSAHLRFHGPEGRRIVLTFQPTFAAGERTRSRTMNPDITLEGADGRLWILDAKWKGYALPGDETDDINQMHAYRDAILRADDRLATERAWCLFPGGRDVARRDTIAYGPVHDSLIGALRLRPGDAASFDAFRALLSSWLQA